MQSVYRDKRWIMLQSERENGEVYIYDDGVLYYPFIRRFAGIVDGIAYYDITTTRGESGPMFYDIDYHDKEMAIEIFKKNFTKYCGENHIIAEYVKFDPWNDITGYFSDYYILEDHGKLYCNDLTIDYFNDEYASTKRKNIRKAWNSGLTYKYDITGEDIGCLLKCYEFTKQKNDISQYYEIDAVFLENHFKKFPGHTLITTVYLKDILLGSALTVWSDDMAHHIYGGYDPEYNTYQASSYIVYLAQDYVKKQGCKLFDQGGATPGSPLETFKEKFISKTEPYIYKLGKKIYDKKIYELLIQQNGKASEGYFPAYKRVK